MAAATPDSKKAPGPAKCGFCKRGEEVENVCGKLWQSPDVAAHHKCMQYSALLIQYKFDAFGGFKINKVMEEIRRGKLLRCSICSKSSKKSGKKAPSGATAGCAIPKCSKTFHFYCAATDKGSVTRRMELKKNEQSTKMVQYRVFCSNDHLKKYEASLKEDHQDIKYVSDSEDESGEEEDKKRHCVHDTPPRPSQSSQGSRCSRRQDSDSSSSNSELEAPHKRPRLDDEDSVHSDISAGSKTSSEGGKGAGGAGGKGQGHFTSSSRTNGGDNSTSHKTSSSNQSDNKNSDQHGKSAAIQILKISSDSSEMNNNIGRTLGMLTPVNNNTTYSSDSFVLCILEGRSSHPNMESVLHMRAHNIYRLPSSSVVYWQMKGHQHLKPPHMLYFFRDLSTAVRDKALGRMKHLLFSPDVKDALKYESQMEEALSGEDGDRSWDSQCKELRLFIQQDFVAAKEAYGKEVGRLKKEKELNTYVVYLVLDSCLDPLREVRAKLMVKPTKLYKWGESTTMLCQAELLDPSQRRELECIEKRCLEKFISHRINYLDVMQLPQDNFLLALDQEGSVTRQLWERFRNEGLDDEEMDLAKGKLVFIGPLDPSVILHRACVLKCMEYLIEEMLTQKHKVFCVFDIGPEVAMTSTVDMLCNLPRQVSVKLYTGLDPAQDPVTCMLLELEICPE